ncbi:MAG: hypothetical protein GX951_00735 [Mollicutes bacterium]|nr:hypothetical protein [Mollicutes bacterium]
MEKKNYILLTIIAVAVLLVSVIGATFAYFASTTTITATSALQATTSASAAVFTSSTSDSITLSITTAKMQQTGSGDTTEADKDTGDLTVSLTGDTGTSCTYNISYTKDSNYDTYTPTSGQETKEFLISGTSNKEGGEPKEFSNRRYDQFTGNVVTGAQISAGKTIKWTFTATIYNLGVDQSTALLNKEFRGSFKVSSVSC